MSIRDEHRELLRAAYGDRQVTVERLGGGLHGRCYRVTGDDFDHAVRMPAAGEGEHRLNSCAELRVLAQTAIAGLTPTPVETDTSLGLVATEFLADARTWSPADTRHADNIDYLATRLKGLHACSLDLPPYACASAAASYTRIAAENYALSVEQSRWAAELTTLAPRFEARFPPETPCHNDLVASNILDDGEVWLVDFEYAVLSAPILDLAGLAGLNDLDADQRARLVGAYYSHYAVPFSVEELHEAIRLVRLLAYFWVLAFAGTGDSEPGFPAFADAMAAMLR